MSEGLGATGEGAMDILEGTIDGAYVKEPEEGKTYRQLVLPMLDAIAHYAGEEAEKRTQVGKTGAIERKWTINNSFSDWRTVRDFLNQATHVTNMVPDENGKLGILDGLRISFTVKQDKNGFDRFTPVKAVETDPKELAEPLTREEVVALLVGATPAEAMEFRTRSGIAGTAWGNIVTNPHLVKKELGLERGKNGRYTALVGYVGGWGTGPTPRENRCL